MTEQHLSTFLTLAAFPSTLFKVAIIADLCLTCNVILLDKHADACLRYRWYALSTAATTCKKRGYSIHAPGSVTKRRAHARPSFPLHARHTCASASLLPPLLFHILVEHFNYVIVNAVFCALPVPLARVLPWEGLDFPLSDSKTINITSRLNFTRHCRQIPSSLCSVISLIISRESKHDLKFPQFDRTKLSVKLYSALFLQREVCSSIWEDKFYSLAYS